MRVSQKNTPKYELVLDQELVLEDRETLYRIRALRDFADVKPGDLGGYVESEQNLSHRGDCWVYNDAKVFEDGLVCDNARVSDNAEVSGEVTGNARVSDNDYGSKRGYKPRPPNWKYLSF